MAVCFEIDSDGCFVLDDDGCFRVGPPTNNTDSCADFCCQITTVVVGQQPSDGSISGNTRLSDTYGWAFSTQRFSCPTTDFSRSAGKWVLTFHFPSAGIATFQTLSSDHDCPPESVAEQLSPLWEFVSATDGKTYVLFQVACCDTVDDSPPDPIVFDVGELDGIFQGPLLNLGFILVATTSLPAWDGTMTYDGSQGGWVATNGTSITTGDGRFIEIGPGSAGRNNFLFRPNSSGGVSYWELVVGGSVAAQFMCNDWTKPLIWLFNYFSTVYPIYLTVSP